MPWSLTEYTNPPLNSGKDSLLFWDMANEQFHLGEYDGKRFHAYSPIEKMAVQHIVGNYFNNFKWYPEYVHVCGLEKWQVPTYIKVNNMIMWKNVTANDDDQCIIRKAVVPTKINAYSGEIRETEQMFFIDKCSKCKDMKNGSFGDIDTLYAVVPKLPEFISKKRSHEKKVKWRISYQPTEYIANISVRKLGIWMPVKIIKNKDLHLLYKMCNRITLKINNR